LGKRSCKRAEKRPQTTCAPEPTLKRTASPRLQQLKHQIGDEEKRNEQEIFCNKLDHDAEMAPAGQVDAQAPQSTHFSASME
jgi:hypothetical protein